MGGEKEGRRKETMGEKTRRRGRNKRLKKEVEERGRR